MQDVKPQNCAAVDINSLISTIYSDESVIQMRVMYFTTIIIWEHIGVSKNLSVSTTG